MESAIETVEDIRRRKGGKRKVASKCACCGKERWAHEKQLTLTVCELGHYRYLQIKS